MRKIGDVLRETEIGSKYMKYEFQDYGLRLAEQLNDLKNKSLYIKLAKEERRELLQRALEFVKESNPRNKARLFMWKLKTLREEEK